MQEFILPEKIKKDDKLMISHNRWAAALRVKLRNAYLILPYKGDEEISVKIVIHLLQ
jgi:hypothetical protein